MPVLHVEVQFIKVFLDSCPVTISGYMNHYLIIIIHYISHANYLSAKTQLPFTLKEGGVH